MIAARAGAVGLAPAGQGRVHVRHVLALVASLALGACTSLAPTIQPGQQLALPASYSEVPAGWKTVQVAGEPPSQSPWWQGFGDPVLSALEQNLEQDNANLQAALARHQQAQADEGVLRAMRWPTIALGLGDTRARQSANAPRRAASAPFVTSDFVLGASLSYELDVWGRVHDAIEAGHQAQLASADDLAALRLSLRANLAEDYLAWRGVQAQQAVLRELEPVLKQAWELAQRRRSQGLVTQQEVDASRQQLESVHNTQAGLNTAAKTLLHALAVLQGKPASGWQMEQTPTAQAAPWPLRLAHVELTQPSTLLEQRPDVAAAERRVLAAAASVGVARAAYFPTFSIGASAGFESDRSGSWLQTPSRYWGLAPQAVLTLVDGGRIDQQVAHARAALLEATANYRQTVLTANADVEDSLAAVADLQDSARSLDAVVASAQSSYELAKRQRDGGLTTLAPLAQAQVLLAQAQLDQTQVQVAQLQARVQLIKALGGGWRSQP